MFAGFDYGTSQCSLGIWRDHVLLAPNRQKQWSTATISPASRPVGAAYRRALRVGSRDSVGEANAVALKLRKASLTAFLGIWRITGVRPVSGLPIRKRIGKPLLPAAALMSAPHGIETSETPVSCPDLREKTVIQRLVHS